ncbi:arginine--tRNA ligase [Simkania negevensis]|uniref:Arginine--tRNA ligase n=1 Tax=Simkania negevensis (strain ATCC VR-1471 / DSM 27360 / Z) TaxID=331113 RepID=F8L445_SIMNZ|nr:arginine--tRNA ligase [Simkania negevensis]CCB90080.1 arginyl-tRNA synthetase [Simkania negevensis Z]
MENLSTELQNQATKILKQCFPDEDISSCLPADITPSTQDKFGHYQCNSAMKLGKILKTNPRNVALQILEKWEGLKDGMIDSFEIAGPGFINITLTDTFLSKELTAVIADERLGVPPLKEKKKIIVEFSSPNVAKELHVGHLRSTVIGDALARLFEFLGHDVLRLNHIGDWGTQFGMLITYLKEQHAGVLSNDEKADLPSLMNWYRESKKCFDADPEFKKRAQLQVVELQSGEPAALAAWEKICEISRLGFQEIYDFLDVKLVERGESFYNPKLSQVIKDYEAKGLIEVSDGAKCVFLEGFTAKDDKPLPMILQKSDGGYNYATTDAAAVHHRVTEEKADRIIYVVDAGQQLHFQMVFQGAAKAGYYDPAKVQLEHVAFGVVLGPDGKKFKTRSGETEKLIDLLQKAVDYAKKILQERLEDATPKEIEELAHTLGVDAVKYADLSCHRVKDYVFSYDRMLKFEGNTAAFLLYAYVRIQGIKRKVSKDVEAVVLTAPIVLKHPTEVALGLHLRRFGETLELMDRDLLPNRLSDYLYELAEKFHAFFRDCRVEGVPEENSRLVLCELTARILKTGLNILGLKTMPRM